MRSKIVLIVFCFSIVGLYAQSNLNAYKYIIVPKKFDFQKTEDKYQLNSLTKFLLNKEGFTTMFEGEKTSQDMYDNPCLGLNVNVINKSGMLSTKLLIEMKNCRNEIVFTSAEGKSKIKEFKKGYQEALRKAFESVKTLDYRYDSSLSSSIKPTIVKNNTPEPVFDSQPKAEEVKPVEKQIKAIEEVEEEVEEDDVEDEVEIQEIDSKDLEVAEIVKANDAILYAQEKPFGYQLVDSAPSVVYLLQKTSIADLYILKNKNGILHKKNEKWVVEYYENGHLILKELSIKF